VRAGRRAVSVCAALLPVRCSYAAQLIALATPPHHTTPHQTSNVFRGRNREDLQGFPFADDEGPPPAVERHTRPLRPRWEHDSARPDLVQLIESGLSASSTDDDLQDVSQVLRNDRGFWSSTGSAARGAGEWLLFRLRGPASAVHYLRLAVYRALYQAG